MIDGTIFCSSFNIHSRSPSGDLLNRFNSSHVLRVCFQDELISYRVIKTVCLSVCKHKILQINLITGDNISKGNSTVTEWHCWLKKARGWFVKGKGKNVEPSVRWVWSYFTAPVFCTWHTAFTCGWKPSLVCKAACGLKHCEEETVDQMKDDDVIY